MIALNGLFCLIFSYGLVEAIEMKGSVTDGAKEGL